MTTWERFIELIRSIFQEVRTPGTSAYGYIYNAVVDSLKREGVKIGGTAALPRVEVHTITEQSRQDKGGRVRQLSITVESIHNRNLTDCILVADENVAILTSIAPFEFQNAATWVRVLGFLPEQRQDMTESSDTEKIVYRILDTFTIWVESLAIDPGPVDPEPEPEPDPTPEP